MLASANAAVGGIFTVPLQARGPPLYVETAGQPDQMVCNASRFLLPLQPGGKDIVAPFSGAAGSSIEPHQVCRDW